MHINCDIHIIYADFWKNDEYCEKLHKLWSEGNFIDFYLRDEPHRSAVAGAAFFMIDLKL